MVALGQIEKEDLPVLRDWRNALRENFRQYKHLNMRDQEKWFKRITDDPNTEMFGIFNESWIVGVCGLCYIDWLNRNAEVSCYIGPEHQGQGFAIDALNVLRDIAFNDFNLHRLWAEIFGFNQKSVRLFEKAGYTYEGTLKDHHFARGQYWDSRIYGLLNY